MRSLGVCFLKIAPAGSAKAVFLGEVVDSDDGHGRLSGARHLIGRSGVTFTPISRFAVTVHDCNDQHVIGFNRVKHCLRKDAGKASANIILKHRPTVWRFNNLLDDMLHRRNEP